MYFLSYWIVKKAINSGTSECFRLGFEWFKFKYLNAVGEVEKHKKKDIILLSDAYYLIGDTYDMTGALMNAIEAYKKSIFYDNKHGEAFVELARMYVNVGDYERAVSNFEMALSLLSDDENFGQIQIDYNEAKDDLINKTPPLYDKSSIKSIVPDLIVNEQYDTALSLLKDKKSSEYLLQKAQIYGAAKCEEEYLKVWEQVSRNNDNFSLDLSDWFYIPYKVNKNVNFWLILSGLLNRLEPGFFLQYESLDKYYPDLSIIERQKLVLENIVCTIGKDRKKHSVLQKKFPLCKEFKSKQVI